MGALALAIGAAGAGSLVQGILGSSAASKAAGLQSESADYAANLNAQAEQEALSFEEQQYLNSQSELAPYLNAGYGALGQLESGMGLANTTPSLSGVYPSEPATLAAENQPPPSADMVTLKSLWLAPNITAPNMSLGVNNNSQATFQQGFESAADDILHAVQSGYLTPQQGQAAMGKLTSQLNMHGGGGLYGNAGPTMSQAQGELADISNKISTVTPGTAPQGGNIHSVYVPSNQAGWENGSPGTGSTLADWAIENSLGGNGNVPLSSLYGTGGAPIGHPADSFGNPFTRTSTAVAPGQVNANVTNGGIAGTTGSPTQPLSAQQVGTAANITPTSLNEQWNTPFVAPTAEQAAQTPGEQFALQQGEQAIERSAAAQGNLLTGGTAKDLNNYAQNEASTYYQQAYDNAMQQYNQAYNIFQNNQTNQFNRLAAISGTGQTTASQLGNLGANFANNAGGTVMTGANAVGNQLNNAAAASASGYVGSANAWNGAIGNASMIPLMYLAGKNNAGNVVNPTVIGG